VPLSEALSQTLDLENFATARRRQNIGKGKQVSPLRELTCHMGSESLKAEQAVERKCLKYAELCAAYEFQPVAVETHGPMDEATISFISELGRKISEYSGDPFDSRYFFQRVSMLIERYNSILFRETFPAEDEIDTQSCQPGFSFF